MNTIVNSSNTMNTNTIAQQIGLGGASGNGGNGGGVTTTIISKSPYLMSNVIQMNQQQQQQQIHHTKQFSRLNSSIDNNHLTSFIASQSPHSLSNLTLNNNNINNSNSLISQQLNDEMENIKLNPLQIDYDESDNKYNNRTLNHILSTFNSFKNKIYAFNASINSGVGINKESFQNNNIIDNQSIISIDINDDGQQNQKQPLLFNSDNQQHQSDMIESPSKGVNILIYSGYMIFLYLVYGLLQELIFKRQQANFYSLYSFVQFLASFIFSIKGILEESKHHLQSNGINNNHISKYQYVIQKLSIKKLKLYLTLSIVLLLCKFLGNESLNYLNYKTKILFQSSKLVPVMIIGGLLFQRSYTMVDYVSVTSMILGLVLFTIGDSLSSFLFSPVGIVLVLTYVFVESIKSILYEKILRDFSSELELSLFTNFFGTIISLPIVFVSGEFKESLIFFKDNLNVLILLAVFIFLGYYANITYLHLMRITDALHANMMSSLRKFITIILSFLVFNDSIFSYHILGIIIFFFGIGIEMNHKNNPKYNKEGKEKR